MNLFNPIVVEAFSMKHKRSHKALFVVFGIIIVIILALFCAATGWAQCTGIEREDIKTGKDGFKPSKPKLMTISDIHALKLGTRWKESLPRQPNEKITATIQGEIVAAGLESDSDIHLVVEDGTGTIVCEIPKPECAAPWLFDCLTKARQWVRDNCGHLGAIKKLKTKVLCTITGVLFCDRPHGFNKPTGWELHFAWLIESREAGMFDNPLWFNENLTDTWNHSSKVHVTR